MAVTVRTLQNFIAGEWVDATSDEAREIVSPVTGEKLADAPNASEQDVVRAARALASELGRPEPAGLLVTIDKQVPTQAGLGGGSADAMAALRLLCEVWAVPPDRDLLARVGGRLGSLAGVPPPPFCTSPIPPMAFRGRYRRERASWRFHPATLMMPSSAQ